MRDLLRGRLTGRLDIDRLIENAALPAPAADCVRTVIKRTRLWKLEKVDVAHELIAHFHDGLEAGATPEQLAKDFGDPRTAAKLIRRAKKRQRPLAWHAMRYAGWLYIMLIAVYLGLWGVLFIGKPNITVDYLPKLNAAAAAVPEEQRAWPIYRAALVAMGYQDDGYGKNQLLKVVDIIHPDEPDDAKWPELADLLQRHRTSIDQLCKAASMPGLGFQVGFGIDDTDRVMFGQRLQSNNTPQSPNDTLIGVIFPHLGPLRTVAILLAADTHLAAINKDALRVERNLIAMLNVSTHATETPALINSFVAISCRSMMLQTLGTIVHKHRDLLGNEQLRNLAHRLSNHRHQQLIHYEWERFAFYDAVQRIYSTTGLPDKQGVKLASNLDIELFEPKDELLEIALTPAKVLLWAPPKEMIQVYDQLLDKMERSMTVPMYKMPTSGIDKQVETLSPLRYELIKILMPHLEPLRRVLEIHQSKYDGINLGIALELYHRSKGHWPAKLEDLVPQYLPAIPIDRITGGPINYRVLDDGPIAYSVGVNRDDDGGTIPDDLDLIRWYGRQSHPVMTWLTDEQYEQQHDSLPNGDWVIWPVNQ